MCVGTLHVCRRESDQLELLTVVSCLVDAETEAGSSAIPLITESSLQSLDTHFKLAYKEISLKLFP